MRQAYQKKNKKIKKSFIYIDIDELKMYGDDDESAFKYKKECEAMIDKTYDKLNNISEVFNIFININNELKKNIESIHEILFNLSDDSRLRQVEINTIHAKIDDTLNFVCNKIYRKNRKSSERINLDKLKLLERMYSSASDIISEIKNEILMIYMEMFELYDKDIDTIHLINSKINKIMIRLKQDLKKIFSLKTLLG